MTLPPRPEPEFTAFGQWLRDQPHAITWSLIGGFLVWALLKVIRDKGPTDPQPGVGIWTEDSFGHRTYSSDPIHVEEEK